MESIQLGVKKEMVFIDGDISGIVFQIKDYLECIFVSKEDDVEITIKVKEKSN